MTSVPLVRPGAPCYHAPASAPKGMESVDFEGPIAIVTAGELFGGTERHVLGLGTYLQERGLETRVFAFNDRELAGHCRSVGLPVTILPCRSSYDLDGPQRLDELFVRFRIRLVHVHGYRAAVNVALTREVRPMVCTLHGEGEPSWRTPAQLIKDRVYRAGEAWACRRRRAVVCFVSNDLRRRHEHRYRGLERRTIANGIKPLERTELPKPHPPLSPGRLHAVAVGRLTRVKGLEFAISALSRLGADHPWHLDLVGEGELRNDLATLAADLGVADLVTFHGFRRDVEAVLAQADALVMPSLHEGLPYALLEAMSLGVPAIASDVGGLAEVLEHERTGLLVPVGDASALASALKKLGDDSALRNALGSAAAAEQRRRYTLSSMGDSYVTAYRHAVTIQGAA